MEDRAGLRPHRDRGPDSGRRGARQIVTGGGTGTHRIDPDLGLFTELQVGSYVFMDSQYLACDLTGEDDAAPPFKTSLMIDSRVVSANTPGMVTIDAGFKAFSTDAEAPLVLGSAPMGGKYRLHGRRAWRGLILPARR